MSLEETCITAMRADSTLASLLSVLPDGNGDAMLSDPDDEDSTVPAVAHSFVPSGTKPSYVLLHSGAEMPSYALGNVEAFSDTLLQILSYTQDDDSGSAQENGVAIQTRIRALLHNQPLTIDGRRQLYGRRGRRLHSEFAVVNSENETFWLDGYEWWFGTAPS